MQIFADVFVGGNSEAASVTMAAKGSLDLKHVLIFICLILFAGIHTNEFSELLFREAVKRSNNTSSLVMRLWGGC